MNDAEKTLLLNLAILIRRFWNDDIQKQLDAMIEAVDGEFFASCPELRPSTKPQSKPLPGRAD